MENKDLKNRIADAINKGEIRMKPKWQFVLKGVFFAVMLAIVLLLLLYISSLIFFMLHLNGQWFLPSFGTKAMKAFFLSLPWIFIATTLVLIFLLEGLIRHYSFGYRRPLLYTILAVFLVVIAGGVAIAGTPIHSEFLRIAKEDRLPIAGPLYKSIEKEEHDFHICTINEINERGFVCSNAKKGSFEVEVTPETKFAPGTKLENNKKVFIFGEEDNGKIEADGIREISGRQLILRMERADRMQKVDTGKKLGEQENEKDE